MDKKDIVAAHTYCTDNKRQLLADSECGCFCCLRVFRPVEIRHWLHEGSGTAVCPYCGTDSVLGASSGYLLTTEFLQAMKEYWLNR